MRQSLRLHCVWAKWLSCVCIAFALRLGLRLRCVCVLRLRLCAAKRIIADINTVHILPAGGAVPMRCRLLRSERPDLPVGA